MGNIKAGPVIPVPAFIISKIHKYLSIPLDFTPFWAYNISRDKERGLKLLTSDHYEYGADAGEVILKDAVVLNSGRMP